MENSIPEGFDRYVFNNGLLKVDDKSEAEILMALEVFQQQPNQYYAVPGLDRNETKEDIIKIISRAREQEESFLTNASAAAERVIQYMAGKGVNFKY